MSVTGSVTRAVAPGLLTHLRRRATMSTVTSTGRWISTSSRALVSVSTFHFVRRFEATYGETPIRYLTRRRIERAQDLLRGANLTVTEGPQRRGGHARHLRQLAGAGRAEGVHAEGFRLTRTMVELQRQHPGGDSTRRPTRVLPPPLSTCAIPTLPATVQPAGRGRVQHG